MAVSCARCGQKQGMLAALSVDLSTGVYHCQACSHVMAEEAREKEREDLERAKARRQAAKDLARDIMVASQRVIVSGTPTLQGYRIVQYLGIDSVEFVIGTGVFSEVTSSIADFFGARSSAFEKKLREAKSHAMQALKYLAAEKGANAVVSVDLDYTQFDGNRIALILNGTFVEVKRLEGGG